jgi:tetratricopeptide (TPR) repeat protein
MKRSWLVGLVLVVVVRATAWAGQAEDLARKEYQEATAAYNLGHFDEAVSHYETAYKLVPDPSFLFNIAQSHRLGGNLEKALVMYRSFLRVAPENSPNRALAEKRVEEIGHKLEEEKRQSPSGQAKLAPTLELAPARVAPAMPPLAPAPAAVPPPQPVTTQPPAQQPVPPSPELSAAPASLLTRADPAGPAEARSGSGALSIDKGPAMPPPASTSASFYKKWWFWSAAVAVVAGGTVTAIVLSNRSSNPCDSSSVVCVGVK